MTESAMPPVCGGGHRGGPPAAQSAHRSPLKDWRPSVTDDTAATEGNAQVPSRCRLGEERVQPASRAPPRRGLARPPIGPSGGHEAMPRARHDARGRDVPPRARPCAFPLCLAQGDSTSSTGLSHHVAGTCGQRAQPEPPVLVKTSLGTSTHVES